MTTKIPSPADPLRIGTRGSPLALAQAYETRSRLSKALDAPEDAFEITVITTTGDAVQDRPLSEIGGKGLFTKEIEVALLDGSIDLAVHSTKDMPVEQPEGLVIECFLEREDPRDAFITLDGRALADLPDGAVVGTSSLRRRAQLMLRRPDLQVVEFRGNVQTRLKKLGDGVAEGTFLAMAGLNRLDMTEVPRTAIEVDDMLPAIAQGAICIEHRGNDGRVGEFLSLLHHAETGQRITAERAFLAGLDGSCETPIAGLAELVDGRLRLRGEVLRPDGSEALADDVTVDLGGGIEAGHAMAARLLTEGGPGFFDWRS